MNKNTRIWREKKDAIHNRVKKAINKEISLCEEEYGLKLSVLNIDALFIGYSKFPETSIVSKEKRITP